MSITLPQNYRPTDREPFMNAMQQEYFRQKLLKWKATRSLEDIVSTAWKWSENRRRATSTK